MKGSKPFLKDHCKSIASSTGHFISALEALKIRTRLGGSPSSSIRSPTNLGGYTGALTNSCKREHRNQRRTRIAMPALRRPHYRDRGLRARLRAEMAAAPGQDRYVMSQISCERRGFAVPMRWRPAGGDLSRPNHANQRADRPLIRSTRRPRCPLHPSRLPCAHPCWSPGAGIAPTITAGAKIKSP
jgi:hypothetical protein